jgi:branched-chain amino acid transport system permease protein
VNDQAATVSRPVWRSRRVTLLAVPVALAALALYQGSTLSYFTRQLIGVALIYAIIAISTDLAWGYTGILSMGQAVFFGVGAYGVGILAVEVTASGAVAPRVTHWWSYPAGLLLGVAVAMAIAAVVSLVSFSGKSATQFYVAVVTLALTVILSTTLDQWNTLGGQQGLSGFPVAGIEPVTWYWIVAAALVVAAALAYRLVRSDFGLLLQAIRDNEQRCRYLGFNVPVIKSAVFVGCAGLAGLAGALYGGYIGFVSPPFVGFLFATEILIWVAVGGRGTLIGPILGAIAINLIGPRLSESLPFVWTLLLGALFVAVVAFIPDGAFPAMARLLRAAGRLLPGQDRSATRPAQQGRQLVPSAAAGRRPLHEGDGVRGEGVAILSIEDLRRGFGALEVLRGVSLEVRRGELVCIVGPNGAGKSTLLGVVSDGTVPHEGTVTLLSDGRRPLRGLGPPQIVKAGIGRKFQTPNLFDKLTAVESVLLARRRGSLPSLWRRSQTLEVSPDVYEIFRLTGLLEYANVPARDLPHGLKQAMELAMTVVLEPDILLLDEPTAGLTADERSLIGDLLRRIVSRGITVVLIEHDFDFVRKVADRIAVLHDGRVLLSGTVADIAGSDLLKRVYLGAGA